MPIYQIPPDQIVFPHPLDADESGILGIGGDLDPGRLLLAYQHGIFPWFSEDEPIVWWFPDPRCVLFPDRVKVAKSMRPYFNQDKYQTTFDLNFREVIQRCRNIDRKDQFGTWLTDNMVEAYCSLNDAGIAHSMEVWKDGELIGGLYGVSIGKIFFGESMFSTAPNASKFGLIRLANFLHERDYKVIDCQQDTPHLRSLGAELVSAKSFYTMCENNLEFDLDEGSWQRFNDRSTQ